MDKSTLIGILCEYPGLLSYFPDLGEEDLLFVVSSNASALEYITNQTDALCLAAVNEYGETLKFVKNKIQT